MIRSGSYTVLKVLDGIGRCQQRGAGKSALVGVLFAASAAEAQTAIGITINSTSSRGFSGLLNAILAQEPSRTNIGLRMKTQDFSFLLGQSAL